MTLKPGQKVKISGWHDTGTIEHVDQTRHEGLWVHVRLSTGQFIVTRARDVTVID